MLRKLTVFSVLTVLLFTIFPVNQASASSFSDVNTSSPFYQEITFLSGQNIITGHPDGTFKSNDTVTRAQAAVMIGKVKGFSGTKRESQFMDVPNHSWASGYIESAADNGIFVGTGVNQFEPNKGLKRGDMAIVLARAFNLTATGQVSFSDVPESSYYSSAIKQVVTAGIAAGTGEKFNPESPITRGQFSAMLARALNESFRVNSPSYTTQYVNTGASTNLNIRSGPGTSYDIIGSLTHNTEVKVLSKVNSNWNQIEAGNVKGYVHTNYLGDKKESVPAPVTKPEATPVPAPKPTPAPVQPTVTKYITAENTLNVRSGPGVSNGVIGTLSRNTEVKVLSTESNGWVKIQAGSLTGYVNGSYLSDQKVSSPAPTQPTNPSNAKIVIDAGHGDHDPGGQGYGLNEKDMVLDIATKTANFLKSNYSGVEVRLTREKDVFLPLIERAQIANNWGADYFVSMHLNAHNGSAHGFETFIYNGGVSQETINRQHDVHNYIIQHMDIYDRGKKRADFAVLRNTAMPAILIEYLFIDNQKENNLVRDASYRTHLAKITADAIAKSFNLPKK